MNYDIFLFIDIIETVPGIQFLREEENEGIRARLYQGLRGNLVIIDISEEEVTEDTGKSHLRKLGLEDLIPAIFPPKSTQKVEDTLEVKQEANND